MILYTGNAVFEDVYTPAKGKNEWGMDTLVRQMQGSVEELPEFIDGLAQGDEFEGYFLQSWEPDKDPIFPTVTLLYKGLFTGGTPPPDIERSFVTAVGRTSKDYSAEPLAPVHPEDAGLGRLYGKDTLWSMEAPAGPGDNGRSFKGVRDRYALSAIMEFTYSAVEARYRYITRGGPVAARYRTVGVSYTLIIDDARITTSDGKVFGREREAFFELTPLPRQRVVSFTTKNVIGTPFWECEDIVRLELGNQDT